jgi:hypothetical protein
MWPVRLLAVFVQCLGGVSGAPAAESILARDLKGTGRDGSPLMWPGGLVGTAEPVEKPLEFGLACWRGNCVKPLKLMLKPHSRRVKPVKPVE